MPYFINRLGLFIITYLEFKIQKYLFRVLLQILITADNNLI